MPNTQARVDLAAAMVPVAASLIGAVRNGSPVEVDRVLSMVPAAHLPALAVVLAAMVDHEQPIATLLSWVTFDEDGRSIPRLNRERRVAQIYKVALPVSGEPSTWDPVMLRACHAARIHHGDLSWVIAGEREYQRRRKGRNRVTNNANQG